MDNRYYNYNCPALMNDGRFISNHVRSSTFDQYVKSVNNINTGSEYRKYLQENSTEIMNNIKAYLHEKNTCTVGGKCLPLSGAITPLVPDTGVTDTWYDKILDDEHPSLDFMMINNKEYNKTTPMELTNCNDQQTTNNELSELQEGFTSCKK